MLSDFDSTDLEPHSSNLPTGGDNLWSHEVQSSVLTPITPLQVFTDIPSTGEYTKVFRGRNTRVTSSTHSISGVYTVSTPEYFGPFHLRTLPYSQYFGVR